MQWWKLLLLLLVVEAETNEGLISAIEPSVQGSSSWTCSRFSGNCMKCASEPMCSFCYATNQCTENTNLGGLVCHHNKGWVSSKQDCRGHFSWWVITLIVAGCVCLCPLISFLCFVYVIKKICCGGGE
eukprot:Protomagalhaensia_sp_Gyna_25__2161@NODE_2174_length_1243_cov_25_709302_g1797_i0_p1_GENE_NODE_2174_length_1243_cov_25_709302_g1797_i0NODE_2174_length_1243_cov_25_709302_g1797_i0_p1_ORF_typecomplete_len128_score10_73PSI/PF01437_25/0_16_NODE_2174_length_1243_cov_25_709302_g1797_i0390773